MTTKHRTAVPAKRRWQADPSSIFRMMNKIQRFTEEEQARVTNPVRLSFEKLRTGVATEPDFHILAASINVTMVLAESIDPLAEQSAVAARDAMVRCWERFQRTGRLGFDGLALQDLPVAIDLHDQLMALQTPLEISKAVLEVRARMDAGEIITDRMAA